MSRDPQRYDVRELRRIAAASRDGVDRAPRERSRGRPARDRKRAERAARSAAFTELLQRQRGRRLSAPDDGTRLGPTEDRPYLRAIPASPEAEYEVGEWLGYLVDVGGHLRSRDALSYYAELGWIDPDAVDALTRRLEGFDAPRYDRAFLPADHRISLVSIVRIASCASTS
jgi:archaellum component FlaD/FlaE